MQVLDEVAAGAFDAKRNEDLGLAFNPRLSFFTLCEPSLPQRKPIDDVVAELAPRCYISSGHGQVAKDLSISSSGLGHAPDDGSAARVSILGFQRNAIPNRVRLSGLPLFGRDERAS